MTTTYTLDDIRALDPCYDPATIDGVGEDWTGTLQDILRAEQVPVDDRLWVALRLAPPRVCHEFGLWCAEQVRDLMTDPRSTNALDVKRRWLDGDATDDELAAARVAAWAAAWVAVRDAEWSTARAAAGDAGAAAQSKQTEQLERLLAALLEGGSTPR